LKILILNHDKIKCGTYQFCKRVYNLAAMSEKVNYIYREIPYGDLKDHSESRSLYISILNEINPDFIIYNYHWDRMPWLQETDITENKKAKHYFIWHDGSMMKNYDKYLLFGSRPPTMDYFMQGRTALLPRPLYIYNGNYPTNDTVTIGSFGFAFNHKNFHTIAPLVGKYFQRSIVNLHFTNPYFGDTPGNRLEDIINLCYKSNTNPNIQLNITTDFWDDSMLLEFLAGNDMNIFMYDISVQNPGISSAIDYALSVKRPIAISNNMMFNHIMSDDILVEKTPLSDILSKGTNPLEGLYRAWDTSLFTKEMEELFL